VVEGPPRRGVSVASADKRGADSESLEAPPQWGTGGGIEAYRQKIPSGASRCRRRTEWSGQRGGAKGDKKGQCAGRSGVRQWVGAPPGSWTLRGRSSGTDRASRRRRVAEQSGG